MATAPLTGRSAPLSESSPQTAEDASSSTGNCPLAASSATAIARSKLGPALRTQAGARLAVSRFMGNSRPEFWRAARTRRRASLTAASGNPTTVNTGRPTRTSTSTVTSRLSTPSRANVAMLASTRRTYVGRRFMCANWVDLSRTVCDKDVAVALCVDFVAIHYREVTYASCSVTRAFLGSPHVRFSRPAPRSRGPGRAPGRRAPHTRRIPGARSELPNALRGDRHHRGGFPLPRLLRGEDACGGPAVRTRRATGRHRHAQAATAASDGPRVARRRGHARPPAPARVALRRDRDRRDKPRRARLVGTR